MTYETVRFCDLVDGSGFSDKVFEKYVHDWMSRRMPSMPLGLLDTDSEYAHEKWEIEAACVHEVRAYEVRQYACTKCEAEVTDREDECCYEDDDELTPVPLKAEISKVYAIYNTDTCSWVESHGIYLHVALNEDGEDAASVYYWWDEAEAEAVIEELDTLYEQEESTRYGFPWAHSYFFLPDMVSTYLLKEAGFTVATYFPTGWGGQSWILAGIDGGGMDFTSTFWAKLVGLVQEDNKSLVETAAGLCYIRMGNETALERLAQIKTGGK